MSALGEMAGGVAHEINTPLGVICLRLEQMEECLAEGDINSLDFLEALHIVRQTADRIAKIVNGLRFFAREGRRGIPEITNLGAVVEDTLSLCRERFAAQGVQLEDLRDQALNSVQCVCRSVEISQVFLNLLNNAFDAVQALDSKWIKIQVVDVGNNIELSVTDSGQGIPHHVQEKMMQPFFTTKEIGKGTGLGLSISKGILEEHGGRLYFDNSCPNTRFVMVLPKASSKVDAA
jgi:C4-dicarboxylate-specific signal transduction histidine kinase